MFIYIFKFITKGNVDLGCLGQAATHHMEGKAKQRYRFGVLVTFVRRAPPRATGSSSSQTAMEPTTTRYYFF